MKSIKNSYIIILLLALLSYCSEPTAIPNDEQLGEGGKPYESPGNLISEIDSVYGSLIEVRDGYAFVAGYGDFYIINTENANTPNVLSKVRIKNHALALYIQNNIALISIAGQQYPNNGNGGVQIVNITDLSQPDSMGFFRSIQDIHAISAREHFIYLANQTNYSNGNLEIVDISNPANPISTKSLEFENYPKAISIFDTLAFVTFSNKELKILNVSNPENPMVLSENSLFGYENTPALFNGREYLITNQNYEDKVLLIDIKNPIAPKIIDVFRSYARNLATSDNYIFLGSADGIEVVNIINNQLKLIYSFKTNGIVFDLSANSEYVYAMVSKLSYDYAEAPIMQIFRIE